MMFIKKGFMVSLFLFFAVCVQSYSRELVHPGISHLKSDLDRMKLMVEAGKDPWITTYNNLKTQGDASFNYRVNGDLSRTSISAQDGGFLSDCYAAYHNALMWYITKDERHAQKCVEIFNAWVNLTNTTGIPLAQGRGPWKLLEGAEIIKHTYDGWSEDDQKKFRDMLVYPGYSTTSIPSGNTTFYWGIFQGDRARHGNQGLFAMRSLMAMGIFLDNDVMYERALRYLQGLPHRPDDLPYPSGPPSTTPVSTGCEFYDEFKINNSNYGNIEDYGYNELIKNYIWESGQSQESSRDQAHSLGGISIITCMAEMAWNQGDNLYGHLDNRILLGWEFFFRYNLSYEKSFPDQMSPWEPTVESGEFIERTDRSGRWRSLKINPYVACNISEDNVSRGKNLLSEPVYEQSLGHYKDRLRLDPDEYKWLYRGFEYMTNNIGVEDGSHAVDHPGWGGLKFRRVSPGDPIRGFSGDVPNFAMNELPGSIEAENFDYFPIEGLNKTYFDIDTINTSGKYRMDAGIDIDTCSQGGYMLTSLEDGEWLTYTVSVPEFSIYDVTIRYAAANAGGKIKVSFGDEDKTKEVLIPFGEGYSTGLTDWQDFKLASEIFLNQGVQPMKISISGVSNSIVLDHIVINKSDYVACDDGIPSVELPSRSFPGNYYYYYEGDWDTLPDFNVLTPVHSDFITDTIQMVTAIEADTFALVFNGYLEVALDGDYSFYLSAGNGSRLLIDGFELLSDDGSHDGPEVSGDTCLMAGYHAFRLEYYNSSAAEELSLMISGPGVPKQALTNTWSVGSCEKLAVTIPENLVQGIQYNYYEGDYIILPNFTRQALSGEGIIPDISLSPAEKADHYAFKFDGFFNVTLDGEYTFFISSNDGSRLLIDGEEIVDNDGTHSLKEKYGSTCLARGFHRISVEYFENTGDDDSLAVMYAGPDFLKKPFNGFYAEPISPKEDQIITFYEMPVMTDNDAAFFPRATSSARLSPTFTSSNPEVATVSGRIIYIKGVGTSVITAIFPETAEYNGASVEQTLTVIKDDTSVDGIFKDNLKIYPNPVSDKITISLIDISGTKLELIDCLGKIVLVKEISEKETSIDVSELSSGIYIAKFDLKGSSVQQKIVVE